jgi:hypothetical protein
VAQVSKNKKVRCLINDNGFHIYGYRLMARFSYLVAHVVVTSSVHVVVRPVVSISVEVTHVSLINRWGSPGPL